jgi:hypothetical protein
MKRIWFGIAGIIYGLLAFSGLSFAHHNFPIHSNETTIRNITQNTPLYLEHSRVIPSNPIGIMQSDHESHASHVSHGSHRSHSSSW